MARWLLVRHGETDWNTEDRLQGSIDKGLSDTGMRQAEVLAARLKGTALSAIYSSDLSRAKQTADAIAAGRELQVQLATELRERSYGRWEGLTPQEIQDVDPQGYARWRQGDEDFAPLDGESLADLRARMSVLATRLRQAHSGDDTILLVGHGGSLMTLTVSMLGIPALRPCLTLGNASLSVLSVSLDNTVLERWNDTSHWEDIL